MPLFLSCLRGLLGCSCSGIETRDRTVLFPLPLAMCISHTLCVHSPLYLSLPLSLPLPPSSVTRYPCCCCMKDEESANKKRFSFSLFFFFFPRLLLPLCCVPSAATRSQGQRSFRSLDGTDERRRHTHTNEKDTERQPRVSGK